MYLSLGFIFCLKFSLILILVLLVQMVLGNSFLAAMKNNKEVLPQFQEDKNYWKQTKMNDNGTF